MRRAPLLLLLPLLSSLPRRASADPPPVAALSVDAALAARVPLALSAETARALLDARLAGARASPLAAHLPALRQLAALGGAVAALGARDAGALWALLAGAADAAAADAAGAGAGGGGAAPARRLFLADAAAAGDALPPALAAPLARALALDVSVAPPGADALALAGGVDVLFLDGARCYGALARALAAAAPRVRGLIAVPATEACGLVSDAVLAGADAGAVAAAAGLPRALDAAAGLKAALFDFLASKEGAREWALSAHFPNAGGLTVLRRVAPAQPPLAEAVVPPAA